MRKMRDSGIEWVGAIPQDWQLSKIGSLYTQRNEKVSDKDYQPLSVTMQGILPQLATAAKTDDGDNRKLVRVGDFAINSRSDRRGSCGISPLDGSVSLINIILTPRTAMHPGYYNWLFHTTLFADEFYKWGHGIVADLWTTRWQEMKSITVPVPEYAEQERIATFLDAECAEIDTVLEKTRASIEEYKKLKQAIITQAVTKGIRGDRPMKDSGIEWIGDIPAEWSVVPFSKFARVSANLVNPSDYQDYLQVSPENIEKDSGKLLSCKTVSEVGVESWNHFFHKGQILYSKIRPKLNKVCIAPFDGLCSADMYPIDTDNISKFVVYTILSNDFNQQVAMITENRVKMPKINQKELSKIIVVLPADRMEQQEIVDYLDGECGKIDALIAKKQQYLTEIENYKKSLIYEYVTGKKEVLPL